MVTYHGKGVFGAIAIGSASVFKHQMTQVSCFHVDDPKQELRRLENARALAVEQLSAIYEKALKEAGEAHARIFEVQKMMLEDANYNESIRNLMETRFVNAEYAVAATADNFAAIFSAMDDAYVQARSADVRDVSDRLIACLQGAKGEGSHMTGKMIVCADDLAPSEAVSLDKDRVLAFVTAYGSASSHTAILARAMNVPAVVGVGEAFLKGLEDGRKIIVDGYAGQIILDPDDETEAKMREKQETDQKKKALLQELKGKDNVTLDGTEIDVFANIGNPDDVVAAQENDAGGIGLFRSEFLYLESSDYPSEEEQFLAYRKVLETMVGKKVIIRTLDIGADKKVDYFQLDREDNPALGLRAIRICLTRPEIFKTQLRALYRASAYGNLGIMFPMITSVSEVEKILACCEEVKAELRQLGLPFDENVETGIMIETPAAAIISDRLAPLVDFFSVGTNDLTQYTLAIDRQNAKLEPFCDTHHEAILRLIQMAAENAHKYGVRIGICGELAADVSLTETFLRMGIDELSVSAPFVLPLRDAIRKIDLSKKTENTPAHF